MGDGQAGRLQLQLDRHPAPRWDLVAELDDIKTGGPDLPAAMGMERRKLAKVLVDTATGAGASLRLATTVSRFDDGGSGVDVTFSDGSTDRYDLVIGADGVQSTVRSMIGIDTEPEPTGMGIWRVFTGRPESITRTDLCFDGPCYIAGFCPTGEDSIYAYLVEEQAGPLRHAARRPLGAHAQARRGTITARGTTSASS